MSCMAHTCNTAVVTGIVLTVAVTKLSIELQQDDAGVVNPTVPRVENHTGTKTQTYYIVSLIVGHKNKPDQDRVSKPHTKRLGVKGEH